MRPAASNTDVFNEPAHGKNMSVTIILERGWWEYAGRQEGNSVSRLDLELARKVGS